MTSAKQTYVYVIGSASTSYVKIGWSIDPQGRIPSLQTGHPGKLIVLWQAVGPQKLERALHKRFADHIVHGEWFYFPDEDATTAVAQAAMEIGGVEGVWTGTGRSEIPPRQGPHRRHDEPLPTTYRYTCHACGHIHDPVFYSDRKDTCTECYTSPNTGYRCTCDGRNGVDRWPPIYTTDELASYRPQSEASWS